MLSGEREGGFELPSLLYRRPLLQPNCALHHIFLGLKRAWCVRGRRREVGVTPTETVPPRTRVSNALLLIGLCFAVIVTAAWGCFLAYEFFRFAEFMF